MVGDFMFAQAAELVARTGDIDVIRLFARTLMSMASGEMSQDVSAYNYGQSTLDYFNRIGGKTASLFATAAQGGAMIAGGVTPRCPHRESEQKAQDSQCLSVETQLKLRPRRRCITGEVDTVVQLAQSIGPVPYRTPRPAGVEQLPRGDEAILIPGQIAQNVLHVSL